MYVLSAGTTLGALSYDLQPSPQPDNGGKCPHFTGEKVDTAKKEQHQDQVSAGISNSNPPAFHACFTAFG